MRQLAGTKTMYRRAHAAPLAGLISGRAKYNAFDAVSRIVTKAGPQPTPLQQAQLPDGSESLIIRGCGGTAVFLL